MFIKPRFIQLFRLHLYYIDIGRLNYPNFRRRVQEEHGYDGKENRQRNDLSHSNPSIDFILLLYDVGGAGIESPAAKLMRRNAYACFLALRRARMRCISL